MDCLETSDAGGHASIAEAYAAILLGFLIQVGSTAHLQAVLAVLEHSACVPWVGRRLGHSRMWPFQWE